MRTIVTASWGLYVYVEFKGNKMSDLAKTVTFSNEAIFGGFQKAKSTLTLRRVIPQRVQVPLKDAGCAPGLAW